VARVTIAAARDRRAQTDDAMTKTMRAAVLRAVGQPRAIEEVPVPVPGPGEVLVRLRASGVCHTDLHTVDGDWPVPPPLPLIPGHEGAGIVAAVGAGVTQLREGDAVGIAWLHDACGTCEYCASGWETLCPRQRDSGFSLDGTFAEYALGHADYVARLPAGADFAACAPILCAGLTTYKGIRETEARPGEWLAVIGVGGLGHLAVQYAKSMGLQVAALDVAEEKLTLARALGANLAINAAAPDAARQLSRATGGGAHGVLVTAAAPAAFAQALRLVRRRGTITLIGLPPGSFPLPILEVVLKRITLRGSIVGTRQDLAEALQFATDGRVRAQIQTTPLEEVNAVLAALRAGSVSGRAVLTL
jgi:alcohol dehydrogenase, propanol-preferring